MDHDDEARRNRLDFKAEQFDDLGNVANDRKLTSIGAKVLPEYFTTGVYYRTLQPNQIVLQKTLSDMLL